MVQDQGAGLEEQDHLVAGRPCSPWLAQRHDSEGDSKWRLVRAFVLPRRVRVSDHPLFSLFRVEILALHNAMNVGGAETTVACGQLRISGGSGGVPSSKFLTKFPSYSPKSKGILVNVRELLYEDYKPQTDLVRIQIWDNFKSYTFPGPPVYTGSGAQGFAPATTKPAPKPAGIKSPVPDSVAPAPSEESETPSGTAPAPAPTSTKVCRRRRSRRAVVFDGAAVGRRSTHRSAARRYASLH